MDDSRMDMTQGAKQGNDPMQRFAGDGMPATQPVGQGGQPAIPQQMTKAMPQMDPNQMVKKAGNSNTNLG